MIFLLDLFFSLTDCVTDLDQQKSDDYFRVTFEAIGAVAVIGSSLKPIINFNQVKLVRICDTHNVEKDHSFIEFLVVVVS